MLNEKILGIDLGSRSVKCTIFINKLMHDCMIFDTSAFYRDYCKNVKGRVYVDFEKIGLESYDKIISTGYGRNNINIDGAEVITELKAHVYGALWQTGLKDFTLLDIGGQDSKVISVKNGKMVDMILNDKCAASCGRYVENMANVLGIVLDEITNYYIDPVMLNSTCAVFGESELIGKISEGFSIESLGAGVNYSLFKRIQPILNRFNKDKLVITGGVAQNYGMIQFLREESGFKEVVIPKYPQLNGAIGCCSYYIGKEVTNPG